MSPEPADPHAAYTSRRTARQAGVTCWDRWERRFVNARVAVALVGVAVGLMAWRAPLVAMWGLAGLAVVFVALLVGHDRVRGALGRARRSMDYYDRGLARLEDQWAGAGEDGARFLDRAHRYAADLDVLGPGSLFQRINTARTRIGEETLAAWLLEPAAPDALRARHAAVEELRDRLDLREELSLVGDAVRVGVDRATLVEWAGAPAGGQARGLRAAAAGLALVNVLAAAAWWPGGMGFGPLLVAVALSWAFTWRLRATVGSALEGVEAAHGDLVVLVGALERIEREPFAAPRLVALQAALAGDGEPASRRLRRLVLMADLLRARTSPMWAPFAALLLWGTQLGLAVEAWRDRNGADLAVWLDAVGELEALCSLAAYAFECPNDPFPELSEDGPRLEAAGLGHPLLPDARCVRNDVALGDTVRVLMISGSNMSGKSTLLRAVGANAVLAFAGAPVRAHRLVLTPLEVGASILVLDSLLDGTSHFFAELSRLREIVTLAEGPRPVLFLVDEILHGTNSQDRRVGTAAVVRGLLEREAIGLATTHDLALAELADELAPAVVNVHFQDDLVAGERRFDYRLRPGVVTRSNALGLMRSMGLLE